MVRKEKSNNNNLFIHQCCLQQDITFRGPRKLSRPLVEVSPPITKNIKVRKTRPKKPKDPNRWLFTFDNSDYTYTQSNHLPRAKPKPKVLTKKVGNKDQQREEKRLKAESKLNGISNDQTITGLESSESNFQRDSSDSHYSSDVSDNNHLQSKVDNENIFTSAFCDEDSGITDSVRLDLKSKLNSKKSELSNCKKTMGCAENCTKKQYKAFKKHEQFFCPENFESDFSEDNEKIRVTFNTKTGSKFEYVDGHGVSHDLFDNLNLIGGAKRDSRKEAEKKKRQRNKKKHSMTAEELDKYKKSERDRKRNFRTNLADNMSEEDMMNYQQVATAS